MKIQYVADQFFDPYFFISCGKKKRWVHKYKEGSLLFRILFFFVVLQVCVYNVMVLLIKSSHLSTSPIMQLTASESSQMNRVETTQLQIRRMQHNPHIFFA